MLQERDRQLLREIGVMRVMDREQAKCVGGFGSTTRVNARLLALTDGGLLRRFYLGTDAKRQESTLLAVAQGSELVQVPYRGTPQRRVIRRWLPTSLSPTSSGSTGSTAF